MCVQYKHIVAIIYTITLFLDRLDLTIINVALPTIADYFGISVINANWISIAFLLALSISIPISNWLGDKFLCFNLAKILTRYWWRAYTSRYNYALSSL